MRVCVSVGVKHRERERVRERLMKEELRVRVSFVEGEKSSG